MPKDKPPKPCAKLVKLVKDLPFEKAGKVFQVNLQGKSTDYIEIHLTSPSRTTTMFIKDVEKAGKEWFKIKRK